MKLDKAIEILTDYDNHSQYYADPHFKTALKLGIAALKWLNSYRDEHRPWKDTLLPGETPSDAHPDPLPPTRSGILMGYLRHFANPNYEGP